MNQLPLFRFIPFDRVPDSAKFGRDMYSRASKILECIVWYRSQENYQTSDTLGSHLDSPFCMGRLLTSIA
jgi:hypothetical protein